MFNTDQNEEEYIQKAVARAMEPIELRTTMPREELDEIMQVLFYEIRSAYIMGRVMKGAEVHQTITEALEGAPQ